MSLSINGDGSLAGLADYDSQTFTGRGYSYVDTVYFTSSGTFTKASYPWLRAIRVKVQGGGGGGGGAATTTAGQNSFGCGGGAGGYSESFIDDLSTVAASETVTVGSGGGGGNAAAGSAGADSSFGTLVVAKGGQGGEFQGATSSFPVLIGVGSAARTAAGTGDFTVRGAAMQQHLRTSSVSGLGGISSDSFLGAGAPRSTNLDGFDGEFGSGGGGAFNAQNQGTARTGGAGGDGIVIVELFA